MYRRTLVVPNALAWHEERSQAAREKAHGLKIVTIPQLAARLAGGFLHLISRPELQELVAQAIRAITFAEIEPIKNLPGTVKAICSTLQKAWDADLDLHARRDDGARIADLALIEEYLSQHLPPGALLPRQLAAAAGANAPKASRITGALTAQCIVGLPPCWQMLFLKLALYVPMEWHTAEGIDDHLDWLAGSEIKVIVRPVGRANQQGDVCANAKHEAIEAMRWVRQLIASGRAAPHDIAIAACSVADWDDHLSSMADDSQLPLHFVHGRSATAEFCGQQASALAEVLVIGLSHDRVVRALRLIAKNDDSLSQLPSGWHRRLARDAPLLTREHWAFELSRLAAEEQQDFRPILDPVLDLLVGGINAAAEAGKRLLKGQALGIWEQALLDGPAEALETTIAAQRVPDTSDPACSVVWGPAYAIAGANRRFVRLLGLNSRSWPRRAAEDPLLPDHLLPSRILEPLLRPERDRLLFRALRGARQEIVYSRSRRDAEGRRLGISPLFPRQIQAAELRRSRIPEHAFSEADRMLIHRDEFAATPRAVSSLACYADWAKPEVTPHDGLISAGNPVVEREVNRLHSASSLKLLLTDPLGFLWRYALGWDEPADALGEEPILLDALAVGNLIHAVLEKVVAALERSRSGFAEAPPGLIRQAIAGATAEVRREWERTTPVPPRVIWERTLQRAGEIAFSALTFDLPPFAGQRSYVEVPFGLLPNDSGSAGTPWDTAQAVAVRELGICITGRIDRLDMSADGRAVRVIDYKTVGECPGDDPGLKKGSELQRCLYSLAVRSLLPAARDIEAMLLYPLEERAFPVQQPDQMITDLCSYLHTALQLLRDGLAPPGIGAENDYNRFKFAFPANAAGVYFPNKRAARNTMVGALGALWEVS